MIVEVRDDLLALSGTLRRNEWRTIQSAVRLRLKHHPSGLILDLSGVKRLTPEGAETLRELELHLKASDARFVVVHVRADVMRTLRLIPDLGSRLPLAETIEEARLSLGLTNGCSVGTSGKTVLVCLLGTPADQLAINDAIQLVTHGSSEEISVQLVYLLTIPRDRPLQSSVGAEEEQATHALAAFRDQLRARGVRNVVRVERTRDRLQRIQEVSRESNAKVLLLSLDRRDEDRKSLFKAIVAESSCPVIARLVESPSR